MRVCVRECKNGNGNKKNTFLPWSSYQGADALNRWLFQLDNLEPPAKHAAIHMYTLDKNLAMTDEAIHTRAKCEIRMIILVTDFANDGSLAHVYCVCKLE